MNVGLVTIAALLLLLPGVGFIVGVNFADKNLREIVFRNTPAELGYVLVVSLMVHLALALVSWVLHLLFGFHFDTATLYSVYSGFDKAGQAVSADEALPFLIKSLCYYLVATFVGVVPGYILGTQIGRRPEERLGKLSIFVKHRWMMQLARHDGVTVYASVLLKDKVVQLGGPGSTGPEKVEYNVALQGTLKDAYFASDGTLLYLVFEQYSVFRADVAGATALEGLQMPFKSDDNLLVIQGQNVAFAAYSRVKVDLKQAEELLGQIPDGLPTGDVRPY